MRLLNPGEGTPIDTPEPGDIGRDLAVLARAIEAVRLHERRDLARKGHVPTLMRLANGLVEVAENAAATLGGV